ncbi:MAG: fused MFS/spermidine synthase [Verrucomicrobiota bacterium]
MPSPPTHPQKDTRAFAIVLTCFFLSGLAALLYQTVWMRYFSIAFGTSELAVVTVLVAYMGGLAIGAAAIRPLLPKLKHPVRTYALLELAIAASAALVPTALNLLRSLQISLLGNLPELPDAAGPGKALFYLAAGFLILTIPTAFMGATLPLLAKGVVHSSKQIGNRIGLLYGINTLGAIAGTLLAAFTLVPALGLQLTATTGIAVNIIAGLLGLAVANQMRLPLNSPSSSPSSPSSPPPSEGNAKPEISQTKPPASNLRLTQLILPLMLLSGAASFAYEVLWTRLLSQIVGGSLEAFATMLAGFLAGIALGSLIASRLATSPRKAAIGLAISQVGIALGSLLAFSLINHLPAWSLQAILAGWNTLHVNALASILTLLPATTCIGATFPFAVRILTPLPKHTAQVSARVYAWNTIGAILGAAGAGFVLLPALGFEGLTRLLITLNLALASLTLFTLTRRPALLIPAAAATAAFALLFQPKPPSELIRASLFAGRTLKETRGDLTFYSVGRSATVAVVENLGQSFLRTNGLPEATIAHSGSTGTDNTVARWLGLLPSLARPQAQSALVIGFGGGSLIEGIPPSVSTIDVIELEEEVIAANHSLAPKRRYNPLNDPRLNITLNDARGALSLTNKKWDIIISQPSHPWTAGASHLYTREFFNEVRSHLTPQGVFLQWMGTDFVDEPLARSLVATALDVFPFVQIYQVDSNIYVLSSPQKLHPPHSFLELANDQGSLLHHTHWTGVHYIEDAAAALLMDTPQARAFAAEAPPSTDDQNLMATRSPRLINRSTRALSNQNSALWNPYDAYLQDETALLNTLAQDPRWNTGRLAWKQKEWQKTSDRHLALSQSLATSNPPQALLVDATLLLMNEKFAEALPPFLRFLETHPEHPEARFYAAYAAFRKTPFDSTHPALFPHQPPDAPPPPGLDLEQPFRRLAQNITPDQRTFLESIYQSTRNNWAHLRENDATLESTIPPRNILFALASVLRARAWLSHPDPSWSQEEKIAAARKALTILNRTLETGIANPELLQLRAIAAAEAGDQSAFIAAIYTLLRPLTKATAFSAPATRQEKLARLHSANTLLKKYLSPQAYQEVTPLLHSLQPPSVNPTP